MNSCSSRSWLWSILVLIFSFSSLFAQDPHRFDPEIQKIAKLPVPENTSVTVFTGSSSIRFWLSVGTDCEDKNPINTGFGGSQMSDLLYFLDETVLRFNPSTVYIYEGDNDIFAEKKPEAILKTTKEVAEKLLTSNPEMEIYFISAKPSPSRWHFRKEYIEFNSMLKAYCEKEECLTYLNVWDPMLNEHGKPKPEIFVQDSLHMNAAGYRIWKNVICSNSK